MWAFESAADKSRVADTHQFQAREASKLMPPRLSVGATPYGFRVFFGVVGHTEESATGVVWRRQAGSALLRGEMKRRHMQAAPIR